MCYQILRNSWEICVRIFYNILSFVPLKPRTRFKSVEQNWCSLITGLRHYFLPLPNSSGLVLFAKQRFLKLAGAGDATVFLTINDHLGVEAATHETWITLTLPKAILIDSCNGLLLYSDTDETSRYYTRFYVVSPIMKQFVAIPIPCKNNLSTNACVAIAFDNDDDIDGSGSPQKKHFQLISYSLKQDDVQLNVVKQSITCQMFSSETRGWSEHQATILNRSHPPIYQWKYSVSFYKKGKLYCLWNYILLVYYVERKVFMAAQFYYPPFNITSHLLWELEGSLYYFLSTSDQLGMYKCVDSEFQHWDMKFIIRMCDKKDSEGWRALDNSGVLKALSFNHDLHKLYLQNSDSIFSYSLETQRLQKVWSHPALVNYRHPPIIYPFLFHSVDLHSILRC